MRGEERGEPFIHKRVPLPYPRKSFSAGESVMRRKALKRAAMWTAAALLALLVLVFAAAEFFLRSGAGHRAILDAANRALTPYGLSVSCRDFGLSGPDGVAIRGLTLKFEGREILSAGSLSLSPLLPLALGKNPPLNVALSGPRLALFRDARGAWSLTPLLARIRKAGGGSGGKRPVTVERLSVSDGRLKLSLPGFSDEFAVNAVLGLPAGRLRLDRLEARGRSGRVTARGSIPFDPGGAIDLSATAEASGLTAFSGLWAEIPALTGFKVTAAVSGARTSPRASFSAAFDPGQVVAGSVSLSRLSPGIAGRADLRVGRVLARSFFPRARAFLNGEGAIEFRAGKAGGGFSGVVKLSASRVWDLAISSGEAEFSRKKGADTLSGSAATAAGGLSFSLSGDFRGLADRALPAGGGFSAAFSGVDPKALAAAFAGGKRAGRVPAGRLTGRVDGRVRKEPGKGLADADWTARVRLSPSILDGVRAGAAGADISLAGGRAALSGGFIRTRDAALSFRYAGDLSGNGEAGLSGGVADIAPLLALAGKKGAAGRALLNLSIIGRENARRAEISGTAALSGFSFSAPSGRLSAASLSWKGSAALSLARPLSIKAAGSLSAGAAAFAGRGKPGGAFSAGGLSVSGSLESGPAAPVFSGTFSARDLKGGSFSAQSAAGRVAADFSRKTGSAEISITGGAAAGRRIRSASLSARPDAGGALFDLSASDPSGAELAASGRLSPLSARGPWDIRLSRLTLSAGGESWRAEGPVDLAASKAGLAVRSANLVSRGQRLSVTGSYAFAGARDLTVAGKNVSLALLARFAAPGEDVSGRADFRLSVAGAGAAPRLAAELSARDLSVRGFALSAASFKGSLAGGVLSGSADLKPASGGSASLSGRAALARDPSSGKWRPGPALDLTAAGRGLDLARLARGLKKSLPLSGRADFSAEIAGSLAEPRAAGRVVLTNAAYGDYPALAAAEARFSYSRATASLSLSARPAQGGSLSAAARLVPAPGPLLSPQTWKGAGLSARVRAAELPLSLAAQRLSSVKEAKGVLSAEAAFSGNLSDPAVSGRGSLSAGRLIVKGLDKPLSDVSARFSLSGRTLTLESASARPEGSGGLLNASGSVGLSRALAPETLNLAVSGEKLKLAYGGYVTAAAGGRVRVTGSPAAPVLAGSVTLGDGELRLDRYIAFHRPEVAVERDIRFEGEKPSGPPPLPPVWTAMSVDLAVAVNGPFWVRGAGAQIEVAGELGWKKPRGRDHAAVTGFLTTVRGVYEVSGKSFAISRGRMDFPGVYPADPVLDVSADYTLKDVVVHLAVTGRLSAMNLTLSSDPAMDEADVASYLLFGKKTGSLTPGQAGTLAEKGAAFVGAQVLTGIKRELGQMVPVDIITVDGGENGQTTSLVVGKKLTPDVFVTYRRGVAAQGGNEVGVEYRINKSLSIESRIGESGSGADVFWTFEY